MIKQGPALLKPPDARSNENSISKHPNFKLIAENCVIHEVQEDITELSSEVEKKVTRDIVGPERVLNGRGVERAEERRLDHS